MVVKASFDMEQMYNEVQTLIKIHDFARDKKQFNETIKSIPQKLDHGLLYVNKNDIQSYYKMNDKKRAANQDAASGQGVDKKPLVYFTMPRFGQNLRTTIKQVSSDISC